MPKLLKLLLICLLLILGGCTHEDNKIVTITFQTNGGNTIEAISINTNEEVNLPTPTKDGYDFMFWYDSNGNHYTENIKTSSDITLYASWEAKEFVIKFFDWDNTLLSEQTVKYHKDATSPPNPQRANYVFIGWDKDYTKISSDLNIYAKYEEATDGLVYQLESEGYTVIDYTGDNPDVIIPSHYQGRIVYEISDKAFFEKTIHSVVLPETINRIGKEAFSGCSSLTTINIPLYVKIIDDKAFMDCSALTKIVIPSPTIGIQAFCNCTALTDITILDTVTTIKDSAFYNCSRLVSFYIPDSVSLIGTNVISWCKQLQYIYTSENNVSRLEEMFKTAGYIYVDNVKFKAK